ncbi:MAG: cytochrome C oxidase subunit II [Chitinophagales bacterium]|nr:cytochrome C oxidase subunit II [Chitinophagales bacterium]
MDRSERLALLFTGIILMVFISAILFAVKAFDANVPECVPYGETFTKGELIALDDKTYQLKYVAKMWVFDPPIVEVPVGSEVDIYLASQDVVHGFQIKGKNVNLMAVPGAINLTSVKFDRKGTYYVICHEYCGVGHQNMQGEIIVK